MRKVMIVFFSLLAIMMMTMPAYAQGTTAAAPATNWVAISSGFAMAIAAGLAFVRERPHEPQAVRFGVVLDRLGLHFETESGHLLLR